MPGYQNTFTLITERVAPVSNEPIRPMTSKQVKKAHKAANKAPKLSRAEQRRLELAEQERIRKELDKDRQANRARLAREKKKAKEDKEKEERRKKGRPLVDVRPSQDTIARFVRGNAWKKKDDDRHEVSRMAPVIEEEPERAENTESEIEREDMGIPVPEPGPDAGVATDRGGGQEEADGFDSGHELQALSQSNPSSVRKLSVDDVLKSGPQNDSHSCEPNEDALQENPHACRASAKVPQWQDENILEKADAGDSKPQTEIHRSPSLTPSPSLKRSGQPPQAEAQERAISPVAVSASQGFWDDGLDDELMQKLDAAQGQRGEQSFSGRVSDKQRHVLSLHKAPSRYTVEFQILGDREPEDNDAANLECDMLAGIGTQAIGLWEKEDEELLLTNQPHSSLRKSGMMSSPNPDPIPARSSREDADALEALETLCRSLSPPGPALQPLIQRRNGQESGTLSHCHPPSVAKPKEPSSFTEEDVDDELLQQLDIEIQSEDSVTANPTGASGSTLNAKSESLAVSRQLPPQQVDLNMDTHMPPPPVPQPPPMSTQAVLSNFDDYFPSPSQQERELEDDLGCFPRSQPTPCPPPKRPRPHQQQQQQSSELPPLEKPQSQKRFFSASGSNELLSLAIHRSRRDAAIDDLQRKDRQRFEAGKAQAKQITQQGRQFMPQRQNALMPMHNHSAKQPRPAGKPPTWITNENIEPPKKRRKMSRTRSHIRPPPFRQPAVNAPGASPKPPVFKPPTKLPIKADGREPHEKEDVPIASQSSDYGGDWIDEMAMDMASAGRGCLSATQLTTERGKGHWIR